MLASVDRRRARAQAPSPPGGVGAPGDPDGSPRLGKGASGFFLHVHVVGSMSRSRRKVQRAHVTIQAQKGMFVRAQYTERACQSRGGRGFRWMDGRLEARGLRKARGGVGGLGVEPGPTAATGGRRAVERRPGLPTGDARGRAWSKVILLRSPSTQHTHDAAGRLLEVGPSVFNLSVSGGPSRFGSAGGRAFWKKENRKQEGGRGPRPPTGSRKYTQGGQGGGAAGKQHQV